MYNKIAIPTLVISVILFLEILFPFRRSRFAFKHFFVNVFFACLNGVINSAFLAPVLFILWTFIEKNQFGLLNYFESHRTLELILSFLIFDFWMYCWHRINHEYMFFWNFHLVHHSDCAMDLSTAFRFHPVEIILSFIFNLLVIAALGISLEQFIVYKLFAQAVITFHHSDIDVGDGFDRLFRFVLVSPQMHRVHHSNIRQETDSNYSSVFSFWDRIFGTFVLSDQRRIEYGLEYFSDYKDNNILSLMTQPYSYIKRKNG